MDPHTYDRKQLIINTSCVESGSSLLENIASMEDHHHHQKSHLLVHDQQVHHHVLPSSLEHHSSVWEFSSSDHQDHNNYIVPFSNSNQLISSPLASSAASLLFVDSDTLVGHSHARLPINNHQHQLTLDHNSYSHVLHEEHDQDEEDGNLKDLVVDEEERVDHETDEELSAMKEMIYKVAAMQPVDIDPSTIHKPKRRNVRISDDPQSVAARHRRERISEKMRILQRLVPGGTKMDTASMLDEAIQYVKFLKRQIKHLQQAQNNCDHHDEQLPTTSPASLKSSSIINHSSVYHQYLTTTMANKQQQCMRSVAAASPSTATDHNCSLINAALLHRHDNREAEKSLNILNMCTSNVNYNVHQCMENYSIAIQTHRQMDIFNQVTEFINHNS